MVQEFPMSNPAEQPLVSRPRPANDCAPSARRSGAERRRRPASEGVRYPEARKQIRTGDVLLFQGKSVLSHFIRWGSQSDYSHAGMAAWWGDRLLVFQATGSGASVLPASSAVDAYDGQVDWWALRPDCGAHLDEQALLAAAMDLLGRSYATWDLVDLVWRMCQQRFRGRPDARSQPEQVFCSQYVSYCYRLAGCDLVPGTDDGSTSPGDLADSPLLELRGVLRADPSDKARRAALPLPGRPPREFK